MDYFYVRHPGGISYNTATFAAVFSDIELVNIECNRCCFFLLKLHVSFHVM